MQTKDSFSLCNTWKTFCDMKKSSFTMSPPLRSALLFLSIIFWRGSNSKLNVQAISITSKSFWENENEGTSIIKYFSEYHLLCFAIIQFSSYDRTPILSILYLTNKIILDSVYSTTTYYKKCWPKFYSNPKNRIFFLNNFVSLFFRYGLKKWWWNKNGEYDYY